MLRRRIGVVLPVVALLAAACSGGSEADPIASDPIQVSSTTIPTPFTTASVDAEERPPEAAPVIADGPLADVCGDTIVVQASSFPDVGSGPLYALLGATPSVDAERQAVSAPLARSDGSVEDVTLEIRSGGPAVGFRSPIAVMAEDESTDLALVSMAVVVRDRATLAAQAVMSLTDRSRDAIIVDPATYPDLTDLEGLREQNVEIRHVTDAPVITFLTATGVLDPDQLISGSDGLPASFVEAGGEVTQQGDLTIEPVLLPSLEQWSRPVTALPASAVGWASLDDMLVVDTETERVSDDCLGRFVRVVQQSIVAYIADPVATNLVMSAVRSEFNPLARLTPELLDAGTQLALDAGVFEASRTDAPGAIATDGMDTFLVDLAAALEVDPVTVEDLVDTRFVDRTISR